MSLEFHNHTEPSNGAWALWLGIVVVLWIATCHGAICGNSELSAGAQTPEEYKMSHFDDDPDFDEHGECRFEISRLREERRRLAKALFITEAERDKAQHLAESNLASAQGRIAVLESNERYNSALVEILKSDYPPSWRVGFLERHHIDTSILGGNEP